MMDTQHDDETTNDGSLEQIRPRCELESLESASPAGCVSTDEECQPNGDAGREREKLSENQCVRQFRRRRDTAVHTLLVLGAMASAVCLSAPRSSSVFVDSFSFKLFHRSGGRQHKIATETPRQILSASAEEEIEMMNNSFENIKNANKKNIQKTNGSTPSLADWKVDMDENRITGRSMNHPFVPDGELITTSCLDPSCMNGDFKAGDVVSTIQGTTYKLLKPPPVGSSYFSNPESTTDQVFKEDVFSYTTTGLPLDEQLAFLEELTNMVKAKQAAELGTSPPVSKSDPPPIAATTSSETPPPFTPKPPSLDDLPSNQPELMQQNEQQEAETPPRRPTFSVNKSAENLEREREIQKEAVASQKDKVDDSGGNVLGGVATVTAAVATSAAVALGGQTGIADDLLDEAKRQAESQMSPQTKEVLASINTQVKETSKVVLPYLEEQIRIAEAKIEEAHLEEKAKSAWNEVSNYLNNEQSRPTLTTTTVATSTSAEAKQSVDSSAANKVDTPANEIAESISTGVDTQATSVANSPKVESATTPEIQGTELATESTTVASNGDVLGENPAAVQAESSVTKEFVEESAKTIEEIAPATTTETVTKSAVGENALVEGVAVSDTSQEKQQVEATREVQSETLQTSEINTQADQLQAMELGKGDSEYLEAKSEAEAEVLRLTEAARIVEEQLEAARREVAQAAARGIEIPSTKESPLAVDTEAAKVEVVRESEAIGKASSSVVETFGGNFVVAQEALNLGNAAVSSTVPDPASVDTAEGNVEKPTTEMMENAITVEVETPTDAELAESVLAGRSVVKSEIMAPATVENSQSIVEKMTDALEKGKRTTQAIGNAGKEAIDTGKRTVQEIKTTSQEIIDTGKRTYESAVDTGKRAVDTGKRTAKAIGETAQFVGVKGKEAYEVGQKYAKIGKEILQDEEKAKAIAASSAVVGVALAYASNSFSIEKMTNNLSSDDIENDDIQSNTINMNAANETLTTSDNKTEDIKSEISMVSPLPEMNLDEFEISEDAIENETESEILEEESENVIEPEMVSSMPPPKSESPYRVEVRTNDVIDTTSTIKPNANKKGAAFGSPAKQGPPGKQVGFGVPSSKDSAFGKKSPSPFGGPPKQSTPSKKVDFGVPSSKDSAFGKKAASPFKSPSKTPVAGKKGGFGVPSPKSSAFAKTGASTFKSPPSPFGVPPKKEIPIKDEGSGVPSTKNSAFQNKKDSPPGAPSKQGTPDKKVEFGVPPSKRTAFSKEAASSLGSSPKQSTPEEKDGSTVEKKVPSAFGSFPKQEINGKTKVPSSKSSTFPKKAVSPFKSPPSPFKTPPTPFKAPPSAFKFPPKKDSPGFGVPAPSNKSSFGKKAASPFGSPPKDVSASKKAGFGIPSPKSNDSTKKAASTFGSIPTQPIPNKKGSEVNTSKAEADDQKEGPSSGSSPTPTASDQEKLEDSLPNSSDSNDAESSTEPLSEAKSVDKIGAPSFGSLPKQDFPKKAGFGVPPKGPSFGKKSAPFGSPPKQSMNIPGPSSTSKSPIKTEGTKKFGITTPPFKGPLNRETAKIASSDDEKDEDKSSESTETETKETTLPKFGIPSRAIPSDKSETVKESVGDRAFFTGPSKNTGEDSAKSASPGGGPTKFSVPPKSAIPTSSFDGPSKKDSASSMKKATPFGKGPAKFPVPPKSTIPTSSFDGPAKKDSATSVKKATPFGKGPVKFPVPPKSKTPSSSFDGPSAKDSVSSVKKGTPFGKGATKFPVPPKSKTPSSSFDGSSTKDSVSSVKKATPFGKGATKFPVPPKSSFGGPSKKDDTGSTSTKKATPFGKGATKFPVAPKSTIPTSSFDGPPTKKDSSASVKKATPFGKGATKFPVAPKSTIPTSSSDGPMKKDSSASVKKATPFGKGATKFPVPPKSTIPTSSFDGPPKKDSSASVKKATPFGKGPAKFPVTPKSTIPTSSFDGPTKKDSESSVKKATPFGKGPAKFPVTPKSTIPTSSFDGPPKKDSSASVKKATPFGKGPTKFPVTPKSTIPTSSFDGPPKKPAESGKTSSTFGGETKSPFPKNDATVNESKFGSSSDDFLSNRTSNRPPKNVDRSYFTDTSRNGYDEANTSRPDITASKNVDTDNNDEKQFPIGDNFAKETSPPSDPPTAEFSSPPRSSIKDDREESVYLTEENQKRFFPEPGSTQVELGYRVGAPPEENQGDTRKGSTYLTGESEGIPSPKKRVVSPRDDSRPRITPYDESVYDAGNEDYGRSPEELMEEVMRIAREQEARNNGDDF